MRHGVCDRRDSLSQLRLEMRAIMSDFGGDSPSERELTPLVRALFPQRIGAQTADAEVKDAR